MFQPLGEITIGPNDLRVVVGSFSLQEGDDTLWIEVQRRNPDGPWPWSYGILSWESDFGLELGSIKAYTAVSGEVFRLGVGRAPRERGGILVYEPRSYNLGWIKKGNSLTLSFSATSGVTAGASTGGRSVAFPVVGGKWRYASSSGLLQLKL